MAGKRFLEENLNVPATKRILSNDEKTLKDFTNWMKFEGFHINEKVLNLFIIHNN